MIGRLPYRKLTEEEINALTPAEIRSGKFNKQIDEPVEERMTEVYRKLRDKRVQMQKRVGNAIKISQARYKASYDKK